MLIDSHCHLNYDSLLHDIENVLREAKSNNIEIIQSICTKISEFDTILQIANMPTDASMPQLFCSVGIHPCEIQNEKLLNRYEIVELCSSSRVIGIGETGLDYYHSDDQELINLQKQSFIEHIGAAQITGLPVIIHTRNAESDTMEIIAEQMAFQKFSGVIHCFTADRSAALKYIDLGLYISASGIVTFKNATAIQDAFANIPFERILIETDGPYLAPVPYRARPNRPAYIIEVARTIANLRMVGYQEVCDTTSKNFLRLFSKAAATYIPLKHSVL